MSSSDKKLFTQHEHALEKQSEVCPECSSTLVVKHSKSGAFFGCVNYPHCQYTRPVVEHERVEDKMLEGSECPLCQSLLAVKQGRYGMFIGCSNYPDCHHIEETHHQESIDITCPCCEEGKLQEKTNRYGKTFYSCDHYPKCKYVLNYPPVAQDCPQCHWPLLIKRKMAGGEILFCPEKKCTYKSKPL